MEKIVLKTPEDYISRISADRKPAFIHLRQVILENLPVGFNETINYGMIGYVIPHEIYPPGYHANPSLPLPFINIAAQKHHLALYHMGLYADEKLMKWFTGEYMKHTGKNPDTGKSCIRLRNTATIPFNLIGELAGKIGPYEWISIYEIQRNRGSLRQTNSA
jgi:hypothetical protein